MRLVEFRNVRGHHCDRVATTDPVLLQSRGKAAAAFGGLRPRPMQFTVDERSALWMHGGSALQKTDWREGGVIRRSLWEFVVGVHGS